MLTFLNLLFLLFSLNYLRKPSLWFIPSVLTLICIAPSLYLAGIVNASTMFLLAIALILYKRPILENTIPVLTVSFLIVLSSLALTWIPYFKNINIEQITGYSNKEFNLVSLTSMFRTAWEAFFTFPIYTTFQWASRSNFDEAFKHADARILSSSTNLMLKLIARLHLFQGVFAFSTLIYGILSSRPADKEFKLRYDPSVVRTVVLSGSFIIISFTLSTWLGGASWVNNGRQDQIVQFLPLSLFVIFLLPFLIVLSERTAKIIYRINYLSLIIFSLTNLIGGFMVVYDQLTYRGNELTEADVPLIDKMSVVKFVAHDWKNYSDSITIPIDYNLGGGRWDIVSEFGISLTSWYPAVYTEGRGFDYALKRQYGLTNKQEGIQLRTFGTSRYLVTYAFEDEPKIKSGNITHYIFGRLRVSIVDE